MSRSRSKQLDIGKVFDLDGAIGLWEAFDSALRVLERDLNQELSISGLSRTSFLILNTLSKSDSPVSTKDLLGITGLMPAAMSGMLTRMEAAKLCYRVEDYADQRVVRVKISPRGESYLLGAIKVYEDWINQNFRSISSAEWSTLALAANVLQKTADRLVKSTKRSSKSLRG